MNLLRRALAVGLLISYLLEAQQPVAVKKGTEQDGMSSSGGYKPPALSWTELLESDSVLEQH